MWLKRPNAFLDGILFATAIGLVLGAIVIMKGTSDGQTLLMPLCQEVVADIEKKGPILAQCPPGTYIEVDSGGNVLCHCDDRRVPIKNPGLIFSDPMPTEPTIPAPFRPHDDKSIQL